MEERNVMSLPCRETIFVFNVKKWCYCNMNGNLWTRLTVCWGSRRPLPVPWFFRGTNRTGHIVVFTAMLYYSERIQSKAAKRKGIWGKDQRFLDLGFQHLFPWIPLDSNQELRAIYIGSVLTPITLHTGHHQVKSPVSPVRENTLPFPFYYFPNSYTVWSI